MYRELCIDLIIGSGEDRDDIDLKMTFTKLKVKGHHKVNVEVTRSGSRQL